MTNYSKQLSKQMKSSSWNKEYRKLFILGCIIGAACFACIYGVRILDFTYDAWLFNGDMDLRQHYIGFCHYRMSQWRFPIGLIDTLSYPSSMSVIYTDSIPIFAVLFKLFGYFLPVKFQYFGLFGLLSFCLMGGSSTLLIRRFTDDKIICLLGSILFTISYPILQRMYYHTALGAHWIIILCLCLWLYQEEMSLKKKIVLWGIAGFVCVGIHSYYLPMAGMIMAAAVADGYIKDRKLNNALPILSFCVTAIVNLYILGGFYGSSDAAGAGLGSFNSNLNTFINPLYDSRLLNELPTYTGFQYEGFGYLGAGVIILMVFGLIIASAKLILKSWDIKELLKRHYRIIVAFGLFMVSFMAAVLPMVAWGDKKIVGIPYPKPIFKVLSIFRSNGRFIWVAMYLLILLAIVLVARVKLAHIRIPDDYLIWIRRIVIIIALTVQLYDMSGYIAEKGEYYKSEQNLSNYWSHIDIKNGVDDYSGFVFTYNDNDIIMDTAYYAYLHGMWQNNYYYARDINSEIDLNINEWKHELKNGIIRDDIIYIFKSDEFDFDTYKDMDVYMYDDHIAAVKSK